MTQKKWVILGMFLLCTGLYAAFRQDSPLLSPFPPAYAQEVSLPPKPFSCAAAPLPIHDIQLESIYDPADENSSIVDPVAYGKYITGSKPLTIFEAGITGMANLYALSGDPKIAICAANWLAAWANADALNGDVNRMGELVRKWVLASVASSWLQIENTPMLDHQQKHVIERWLRQTAINVRHDFLAHDERKSRNNNHLYWAGWSMMATGVALNDRAIYEWGLRRAQTGIKAIRSDGSLPLEMARGRKALNYHSYAAIPLFMMAETALQNGTDLYAENNHALFRLARLIIAGVDSPDIFVQKTGEVQDVTRTISASNLVWLEPYYARSYDPDALVLLNRFRPMRHSRAGGNLTQFYASTTNREAK